MKLRKRRNSYSYGTYTRKRRLRLDRIAMVVGVVVVVVGLIIVLNYNRIRLIAKGYSLSQTSQILKLTKSEQREIIGCDKINHIKDWIVVSNNVTYYDEYEKYLALNPDMEYMEIAEFINAAYGNYGSSLKNLGYDEENTWDIVSTGSLEDLNYIVTNRINFSRIKPYYKEVGFDLSNVLAYEEAYATYNDFEYAFNIVNYPFIISSNYSNSRYTIKNVDDIDILVKKGFYLPSNYEPKDLVDPKEYGLPVSENSLGSLIRKEACEALKDMFDAANKAGYGLVINSAYRSYLKQEETYESFENMYGGLYAAEYVALPGASEHQTGLGIDLTSQSVLDGTYNVFGDSRDYLWVVQNCHKYGFIIRFEDDKADITGIAHEPWHVRYVGKEAAKKVVENSWTFEEYCLYEGNIPEFVD